MLSTTFCLLATEFNRSCSAIDLVEDNLQLDISRTFVRVPVSRTTTQFLFGYITCKSLESYQFDGPELMVPNSADYFMVSCSYLGKTSSGANRLTGALVFCMGEVGTVGRTMGIILQDCHCDEQGYSGAEFKVALTASHLRKIILMLDSPPKKKLQRERGKTIRKRGLQIERGMITLVGGRSGGLQKERGTRTSVVENEGQEGFVLLIC